MNQPSKQSLYFNTAIQVGLALGLLSAIIQVVNINMAISAEPSTSIVDIKSIVVGILSCLLSLAVGAYAVKHYLGTQEDKSMKLGEGALIGLYTAIVSTLAATVLIELWLVVDADMYKNYLEATMRNFEANPAFTDELLEGMESQYAKTLTLGGRLGQLLFALPIGGIIMALAGMVGVKIFAEKEEEL